MLLIAYLGIFELIIEKRDKGGRELFFLPITLRSRSVLVSIILHSQPALVPAHCRATLFVCKSGKSLWMGEVF